MYQKNVKKACLFLIDRRRRQKALKHVYLLLKGEEGKKHYLLIIDFLVHLCVIIHYVGKKTFLSLWLTSIQYIRNIKRSY